jgi:hypothetical protein
LATSIYVEQRTEKRSRLVQIILSLRLDYDHFGTPPDLQKGDPINVTLNPRYPVIASVVEVSRVAEGLFLVTCVIMYKDTTRGNDKRDTDGRRMTNAGYAVVEP